MIKHYQIVLKGSFRQSGFRFHTLLAARTFSICGMVTERDGDIIVEAEGVETNLEKFVKWCRRQERSHSIESVEVVEKPLSYCKEFLIL